MPTSRINRMRAEIVSGTVEYLSEVLRVCTRQERSQRIEAPWAARKKARKYVFRACLSRGGIL